MSKIMFGTTIYTVLETLPNGSEVIARRDRDERGQATQPSEIVLCYLAHNDMTPFATWQRNVPERGGDGSTYWGHYFDDISEAEKDFKSRGK